MMFHSYLRKKDLPPIKSYKTPFELERIFHQCQKRYFYSKPEDVMEEVKWELERCYRHYCVPDRLIEKIVKIKDNRQFLKEKKQLKMEEPQLQKQFMLSAGL